VRVVDLHVDRRCGCAGLERDLLIDRRLRPDRRRYCVFAGTAGSVN
jgi:hypothetical protein